MQVTAEDPAQNQYIFELYDDGQHGDGDANDGVYANTFSDTSLEGSYNFNVLILGANNRDGQPFTREYALTTLVDERDYPSTTILDDFNRSDGEIGDNWSGNTSSYRISSNQLLVRSKNANLDIYWGNTYFGPNQEAYFTFSSVGDIATDQDLLLKSQGASGWGYSMLAVKYDAVGNRVTVWTFDQFQSPAQPLEAQSSTKSLEAEPLMIVPESQPPSDKQWIQHGAEIPVTFVNGDQFGARAWENGTVEIYRNGVLLATREVTSWPYYSSGGYLGLWFGNAKNVLIDDFGGGNVLEP